MSSVENKIEVKYNIDGNEIKLTPAIVKEYIVGDPNANITMQEFKLFTECEEKAGNIVFKIPNFLLGATIQPDTIYFLNECQTFSPMTLKLLMARVS